MCIVPGDPTPLFRLFRGVAEKKARSKSLLFNALEYRSSFSTPQHAVSVYSFPGRQQYHHPLLSSTHLPFESDLVGDARSPLQLLLRLCRARIPSRYRGRRRSRPPCPALPVHRHRRRRRRICAVFVVPYPVKLEVCTHASHPAVLLGGKFDWSSHLRCYPRADVHNTEVVDTRHRGGEIDGSRGHRRSTSGVHDRGGRYSAWEGAP